MNIKEKTVFHICRHKELANILKEGEIFFHFSKSFSRHICMLFVRMGRLGSTLILALSAEISF